MPIVMPRLELGPSGLRVQCFNCLERLFPICSISLWCGLIWGDHGKHFRINPTIHEFIDNSAVSFFPQRTRNTCQTKAVAMVTTLFGPDISLASVHLVCPQMGWQSLLTHTSCPLHSLQTSMVMEQMKNSLLLPISILKTKGRCLETSGFYIAIFKLPSSLSSLS